jgi:hypothetical protein
MTKAVLTTALLAPLLFVSACSTLFPLTKQEKPPAQPVISKSEQKLEDKLLLIEFNSLLDSIALIESHKLDKDNKMQMLSRVKSLEQQLTQKEDKLLSCSIRHKNRDLDLALQCAQAANKISPTVASKSALNYVEQQLADKAKLKQVSQTAKKQRKRDSLMALAKKQTLQPNHSATIKTLNRLLALSPDDKEAKQLLHELKSIQKKHVVELIAMGDSLYRNEKIEQALAVWRAAKNLSENNMELLGKIDRAEKVLGSVNKIKGMPNQPTAD